MCVQVLHSSLVSLQSGEKAPGQQDGHDEGSAYICGKLNSGQLPSVSAAKESQALLDLKVLLLQRLAEAKRGELDARDFLEISAMEMRRRGRK